MIRYPVRTLARVFLAVAICACGPTIALPSAASISGDAPIEFYYHRSSGSGLLVPSALFYDTGAVVYHGGRFHMFYNCQYDWPPSVIDIAYAVSDDGLSWRKVRTDSIIAEGGIPYAVCSILASSVFVMGDGTWVLYFYSWANGGDYIPPSAIGRATAPSPEGPWTVDPEPVLVPSAGGWDSDSVQRPDVLRVGDVYYLYYVGTGPAGSMIGMASSSDGIHWTRYDDPATTDSLYAESDPVLTPEQGGSSGLELRYPRVRVTPDGWLLFYWTSTPGWPQANPLAPTNGLIRLATSRDGVHWTRAQEEPILTPEDIGSGVSAIYTHNVVFIKNVYYMFLEKEVFTGEDAYTRILLTTHEGLLFP